MWLCVTQGSLRAPRCALFLNVPLNLVSKLSNFSIDTTNLLTLGVHGRTNKVEKFAPVVPGSGGVGWGGVGWGGVGWGGVGWGGVGWGGVGRADLGLSHSLKPVGQTM